MHSNSVTCTIRAGKTVHFHIPIFGKIKFLKSGIIQLYHYICKKWQKMFIFGAVMNLEFNKYIRTDLACESIDASKKLPEGVRCSEENIGSFKILKMEIDSDEEAKRIGKGKGEYMTFICKKMTELDDGEAFELSSLIASELVKMAAKNCKSKPDGELCVLVAGLGNAKMTPDAIGTGAVSRITATAHLADLAPEAFRSLDCCRLCAIAPGVLGDTGIESLELIRGAANAVHPDIIVAVDALAARSADRLAATVQMSDSGISPGSGVGNRRSEISRKTLGVPVIAIGVPTVVDSATLVLDALECADISTEDTRLHEILNTGRSYFVAPRDSDLITERASCLLADAVDMAFGINRDEIKYN